jgi:Zn-dependent peptidase ImmA (M78 family)
MGSLLFELGMHLRNKVGSISLMLPESVGDPVFDAERTRASLGFSADEPITNLIRAIERIGVFVVAIHLKVDEHDAFSLWAKEEKSVPVIVVSAGKSGDRLRFSVAHELGHIMLHRGIIAGTKIHEREADVYASELLLPSRSMRLEMIPPINLTKLAELKARWGVSIQALLVRALHLGIVTMRQYKYLFQQLSVRGWRTKEPVEITIERPRLIRQMIEKAYGIPVKTNVVAEDLGIPENLVQQILEAHAGTAAVMSNADTKKLIAFKPSKN